MRCYKAMFLALLYCIGRGAYGKKLQKKKMVIIGPKAIYWSQSERLQTDRRLQNRPLWEIGSCPDTEVSVVF